MKKLLSVLLMVALMLSMVACGGNADNKDGDKDADKDAVVTAKVIDIELTQEEYAFGVDKTQPELVKQVNDFIAKIMDDGTFEAICDKYFGDGEPTAVTSAEEDDTKDQLLVATNAEFAPFEY